MFLFMPHPALQHLIYFYACIEIDFSKTQVSNQYLFTPTHKKYIVVYLEEPVTVSSERKSESLKDIIIVGPQTKPVNLDLRLKHKLIAIKLKPCAQYYLINRFPLNRFADDYLKGEDVFGKCVNELTQVLKQVSKPLLLKYHLDDFFLKMVKWMPKPTKIDVLLEDMEVSQSVDELSRSANISVRQFERICNEKRDFRPKHTYGLSDSRAHMH